MKSVAFIPIFNTSIITTLVKKTYDIALLLIIAVTWLFPQEINAQVTGRVTDSIQQPIPQVNIIIKKTARGTQTDAHGKYIIFAKIGDTLIFSHIGMRPVKVRVERSPSVINVGMQAINIELEEVEIKTKAKSRHGYKTQKELLAEYPTNKNLIKTSWRIIDKELSTSAIRIIDGKDLIPVGPDFLTSLQNHVPHMRVVRGSGGVGVFLQQLSFMDSPSVIFDVDGFILLSPPTLYSNEIDRIAILERNAAMSRYGPQGTGGVIVVNTKAQTWMDDMGVIRTYDNRTFIDSLLREVTLLESYRPYYPPYIEELQEAKTQSQTLAIYENQKESYLNNPYYFLEVYDFFSSRWGNNEKSKELFQHIIDCFSNDVPVLKALAYLQQQYGNYESALSIYLKILILQSEKAQSYRDVANAFAEVGDFNKALTFNAQYIKVIGQLTNTPFDAYGDDQLITTEMMNILERNKEVFLDSYDIDSAMYNNNTQTRLVLEWNNQEAEFDLQFVTPDGYYDTWGNNPGKDVSQNSEAVNGYSSKQIFIDNENKGLWRVNINYKGNRSEMPTYLKVSVYHDYGLPGQQVDIKVYKLSENHEKVQLFVLQQS